MGRHKAAVNCDIRPWLSARPDCKEGRFIQVGNSLYLSKTFQSLSSGAQQLYERMTMESGGRQTFLFPLSAAHKYGIAESSFRRYVKELIEAGFIERRSNKNLRKPNDYCFLLSWKDHSASPK